MGDDSVKWNVVDEKCRGKAGNECSHADAYSEKVSWHSDASGSSSSVEV